MGWYSTGGGITTRSGEAVCPAGSYCTGGVRVECPSGRYGGTEGLADANCTALCAAGTYCEESAVREQPCGGNGEVYCPEGSEGPTIAEGGTYTTPTTAPAGSREGVAACPEGFFCREGVATACGAATVYCAAGASDPVVVLTGEYTLPEAAAVNARTAVADCPPGE